MEGASIAYVVCILSQVRVFPGLEKYMECDCVAALCDVTRECDPESDRTHFEILEGVDSWTK